jgi:hypothetical protein
VSILTKVRLDWQLFGVRGYVYVDSNGQEQTVDFTRKDPVGGITVTNIVNVTLELIVTLTFAGAIGMFYWFE